MRLDPQQQELLAYVLMDHPPGALPSKPLVAVHVPSVLQQQFSDQKVLDHEHHADFLNLMALQLKVEVEVGAVEV